MAKGAELTQDSRQKTTTPPSKADFVRKKPDKTVRELLETAREKGQEQPAVPSEPED